MNRLIPLVAALALVACGAQERGPAVQESGPYSQDATAACLESVGYEFEIGHGDPPSMRAEDIVFSIWFEDLGETWIDFYHPSKEIPSEGEQYDNAIVFVDETVSTDDHNTIVGCLR